MAKKPYSIAPGELEILRVIWSSSPRDVRTVHQTLRANGRDVALTTVATQMTRMETKGLLESVDGRRPKLYSATVKQEATAKTLIDSVIKSVFGGSKSRMVLHLIRGAKLNPADRQSVQDELDKMA